MIKFEHHHCMNYSYVSETMIRMIQDTLPRPGPVVSKEPGNLESPSVEQPRLQRSQSLPPPYPGLSGTLLQAAESPWLAFRDEKTPASPASPTQGLPIRAKTAPKEETENPWSNGPCLEDAPDVSTVKVEDLIQPIQNGREHRSEFSLLREFDTVFLLDDTGSMVETDGDEGRSRWEELIDSLRYTVEIVCRYDKDGVEVHFLNQDEKDEDGITEGQRVLDLLTKEVGPDEQGGGTYISNPLWAVLAPYIDRFEDWKNRLLDRSMPRVKRPKMLNLIVITDGAAEDKEGVEDVIVNAAKRLDQLGAPANQVGIQFLQIGKDNDAARWLKLLDDSLREKHTVRDVSRLPGGVRWGETSQSIVLTRL